MHSRKINESGKKEILDIIIAWAAISLAFGIIITAETRNILTAVLVSATTVGIGFIAHELAHRTMAKKYKCTAVFKKDTKMLLLAIIMSLFGFVFAAPGGVAIRGTLTKKQYGLISAAGPAANMLLAIVFMALMPAKIIPKMITHYGAMINALLGVFNLIPLPGFDGQKILWWSKAGFIVMVATGIILNTIIFVV